MSKHYSTQEHFSIAFEGPAIEQHKISASALAQSLLALDGLARSSAQAVYGRDTEIDIQVKGDARPGAFSIDMAVRHDASLLQMPAPRPLLDRSSRWGNGPVARKSGKLA